MQHKFLWEKLLNEVAMIFLSILKSILVESYIFFFSLNVSISFFFFLSVGLG